MLISYAFMKKILQALLLLHISVDSGLKRGAVDFQPLHSNIMGLVDILDGSGMHQL